MQVTAEKLELLYRQSCHGVYGSMAVAALWVSLMWSMAERGPLLAWLALLATTTFFRVGLFLAYFRAHPGATDAPRWRLAFTYTLWLSSAVWGLGTVVVMPKDSLLAACITLTFLVGLAGAALAAYSLFLSMLYGVLALILAPLLLWFMWRGDAMAILLSVSGFWFLWTSVRAVGVHNVALERSFQLAHQLREAKRVAEWHADRDALTGLRSRRCFNTITDSLVPLARRQNQSLCMLLIDIDNFKSINDQYGHAAGDYALIHVARCIAEVLRASDICGRQGGDEFAILLPATSAKAGRDVAEKLRLAIEGKPVLWGETPLMLSISIGISSDGETSEELLKQADKAMYQAKRAGKNQVAELSPA